MPARNGLLTPEQLGRKTLSLTGFQWGRFPFYPLDQDIHNLNEGYRLLYGGIDSAGVTERATDVTATMAAVAQTHAIESACPIVLRDLFLVADSERRLFDRSDLGVNPASAAGEAQIRARLVALHEHLLGVTLGSDHADIQAGFDLFRAVHAQRVAADPAGAGAWFPGPNVRCAFWQDLRFFAGIDDAVLTFDAATGEPDFDFGRALSLLEAADLGDPGYIAQTLGNRTGGAADGLQVPVPMNRRDMLRALAVAGSLGSGFRIPLAHAADYSGRYFVFVQADGGWDPTSFCDPKVNVGGRIINNWAETDAPGQAGNIAYAPVAGNAAFFNKYFERMLVINGVDAQTNAHSVGKTHNWSGRNSEGFPTMTALLAAHYAPPEFSMPYLTFGGFSNTAGVARFTRLDRPELVRNVANPALSPEPAEPYLPDSEWSLLQAHTDAQLARLQAQQGQTPRAARQRSFYRSAFGSTSGLAAFADALPADNELLAPEPAGPVNSTLKRQAQILLTAFAANTAVSADMYLGGFDTHDNHDADSSALLTNLTESVDFLWEEAERLNLADRLVVVMASDFGRTNAYNADNGKDHWPIGSVIVMEKNVHWGNRVAGATTPLHFAQPISPATLTVDDANGTVIFPRHVHKALRSYLGIGTAEVAAPFPFVNTEDFAFFT